MAGLAAVLFGATGATGKHLLREVLVSDQYTKVGEYGRRVTDQAQLPNTGKLEQKTINFDKIEQEKVSEGNWDVVYITLGTTRNATKSIAEYEKIDRTYVINAAKAAKSTDSSRKQRLVYVSSTGSNPSSMFQYTKSKGLTEQALASLGYDDVIVFRPAMLADAERSGFRLAESIAGTITRQLSRFSNSVEIPVATLAKAIRIAGTVGTDGIPADIKATNAWGGPAFTVLNNAAALKLAATQ